MTTAVEVLLAVSDLGGHLNAVGDKLRLLLPPDCLPELKDAIHEHKITLLRLLCSTFVIVESRVLNEIVFFVADEQTKQLLVASGAPPGNTYTKAELQM